MFYGFLKRQMPLNPSFSRPAVKLSLDTSLLESKASSLQLAITSPWRQETSMVLTASQDESKQVSMSPSEDALIGDSASDDSSPTRKAPALKNPSFIEKLRFKKPKSVFKEIEPPAAIQTPSLVSISSYNSNSQELLPPIPSTITKKVLEKFVTIANRIQ